MAQDGGESAKERYLREQREYQDALAAYREVLGGVANQLPMPGSMIANYGTASDGYERAATDPWITERFPELAAAAQRVEAEAEDYFALDEPGVSHARNDCSIPQHVANKFLEYIAMVEMMYLVATDSDFRREVMAPG